MSRWILLVVLVACDRSPDAMKPPSEVRAETCHAAYVDYQKTWHVAMHEDLADLPDMPSDVSDGLADKMSDGLPTRSELAKMREIHALGRAPDAGSAESPAWVAAYAAAAHAIDLCGESAKP